MIPAYLLKDVIKKLNVSDTELDRFSKLKDTYYLTDNLLSYKNRMLKLTITLDNTSIGYLVNNVTEKDLHYTLKLSNKIIYKNKTKQEMVNLLSKLNLENK